MRDTKTTESLTPMEALWKIDRLCHQHRDFTAWTPTTLKFLEDILAALNRVKND